MTTFITGLLALCLTNISYADDTVEPNIEEDIKAFHNAPEKVEEPTIDIDPLEEEDGFEMDLSIPVTASIENPEVELAVNSTISSTEVVELTEDGEPVVDPAAANIEWNLDLSEDLEVGDAVLTTDEEPKSEPVNLDYLEE